jgi:hypothetical protein
MDVHRNTVSQHRRDCPVSYKKCLASNGAKYNGPSEPILQQSIQSK